MKTNTAVRKLLNQANALAFAHVKAEATEIMQRHENLSHHCMAVGTSVFYEKGIPIEGRHYTKKILKFIDEFDSELKLSGSSMRLTRLADGQIKFDTHW